MIRKRLFILLFLVVSLACAFLLYPVIKVIFFAFLIAFQPHQDTERPLSTVFDNLVCEPPCWNNIIPGQTTYEEAYNLLKKLAISDSQIYTKQWEGGGISFYHYPVDSNKPFDDTKEEVLFRFKNRILVRIEFEGDNHPRMSLNYVLSRLGEPDYAVQDMYADMGEMTILHYPERGIEIRCMPHWVRCTSDSEVRVYFYLPASYESRLVDYYGSLEKAQYAQQFFCPWVGVDAEYLLVNWGPFRTPPAPTTSPEEIANQCPNRK